MMLYSRMCVDLSDRHYRGRLDSCVLIAVYPVSSRRLHAALCVVWTRSILALFVDNPRVLATPTLHCPRSHFTEGEPRNVHPFVA